MAGSPQPFPDIRCAGRRSRIGEEFDFLDGLLQIIKSHCAALEQRAAVDRGLYPLRTTVEQRHAESMFQGSDDLRYRGLRDAELVRGLGHAAGLHHGEEHMQVAQPQAPPDVAVQVRDLGH